MKSQIIAILFILLTCNFVSAYLEMPIKLTECPKIKSPSCINGYMPVCAWMDPRINCVSKEYPCAKNAYNPCVACNIRDAVSYSMGPCPESHLMFEPKNQKPSSELDNLTYTVCTEESKTAEVCTEEYEPTCAWLSDDVDCRSGNAKSPCGIFAPNKCHACLVKDAVKFTVGECPNGHLYTKPKSVLKFQFTECSEESKNAEVCPMIYEPKCAWYGDNVNAACDIHPCAQNAQNACEACKIREAVKFTNGYCPPENLAKHQRRRTGQRCPPVC